MLNQLLISPVPLLVVLLLCFSTVFSQSPAQSPQPPSVITQSPQPPVTPSPIQSPPLSQPLVQGPAPAGPPNITKILERAGHFNTLIRLLKSTQLNSELYKQLNDSSQTLTMFAPNDNAFANLKTGTLNTYSDNQKFQLVKFHLISSFLSVPAFQTVSNPISTQAGSSTQYPLNVTVSSGLVNISTGIVNATVSGTIYSDNQLAIYQVDRVLLPLYFFMTPSPAPAPSVKPLKESPSPLGSTSTTPSVASTQSSGAMRVIHHGLSVMSFSGFLAAALFLCV